MRGAALALIVALGGCASVPQQPVPTLVRYLPPERGGPRAFPEASPSGVLDLSGPCVALRVNPEERPDQRSVIIGASDLSVGRDRRGPYLRQGKQRFRHGDWVKGGGGGYDTIPAERMEAPVPAACRTGSYLVFYDLKQFNWRKVKPLEPPVPPPGYPSPGS